MLTVNSGRLGPETMTNPGLAGTLANNMMMATIKLRSLTSAFENNCLIPRLPLLATAIARVQGTPALPSILSAQQAGDQKNYQHPHTGGDADQWRVVLASFRQQIRGADVKKRTGEKCQQPRQHSRPQIEHQRRGRTQNRRQHIRYQPENRASGRIPMRKNDRHGG